MNSQGISNGSGNAEGAKTHRACPDLEGKRGLTALALVTLVGVLLSATGCRPEIGRVIWMIGDSTCAEIQEEASFAFGARDRGDVVIPVACIPGAALGTDNAYFVERIGSARDRLPAPDAVVVSLGTNDILHEMARAQDVDAFFAALPSAPTVYVLPGGPALDEARRQAFNSFVASRPGVRAFQPAPVNYDDGVHFGPEGEAAVSQTIRDAVDLALSPSTEPVPPTEDEIAIATVHRFIDRLTNFAGGN